MNTLKKLQFYMGKRKVLMPIALTLSGLSGLLSLMPFIFIWLIVRSLLLTGSVASGIPINVYAWWAVGTAVAGLVIYFAGLMLLHLAAFRVETNMRRTAMRKIMQMPLGFFDRNTSGQMRKIIDENASETHTSLARPGGEFYSPAVGYNIDLRLQLATWSGVPDPPHGGCLHHDTDEYNCSEGVPK